MKSYQHTQIATLVLSLVAVVVAFLGVLAVTLADEAWWLFPVVITVVAVVVALLFGSLTVKVGDGVVQARFGVGLIGRSIPLEDVVSAKAVRNKWWYGWGIRLTPFGWMFNVSGLDAVELELGSGKRFRIGTDEPVELLAAIETATAA